VEYLYANHMKVGNYSVVGSGHMRQKVNALIGIKMRQPVECRICKPYRILDAPTTICPTYITAMVHWMSGNLLIVWSWF
jgi:hypothetical protein